MVICTIEPRFGDMDVLGHINNTALAQWFETARNPFFRIFSPDMSVNPETWPLIMAHTDFDFLNELLFKFSVEVRTGVAKIGTKSFTLRHEAWQEGKLCVRGNAVLVYYDFNTKETMPIPEDKKRLLAEYLLNDGQT